MPGNQPSNEHIPHGQATRPPPPHPPVNQGSSNWVSQPSRGQVVSHRSDGPNQRVAPTSGPAQPSMGHNRNIVFGGGPQGPATVPTQHQPHIQSAQNHRR